MDGSVAVEELQSSVNLTSNLPYLPWPVSERGRICPAFFVVRGQVLLAQFHIDENPLRPAQSISFQHIYNIWVSSGRECHVQFDLFESAFICRMGKENLPREDLIQVDVRKLVKRNRSILQIQDLHEQLVCSGMLKYILHGCSQTCLHRFSRYIRGTRHLRVRPPFAERIMGQRQTMVDFGFGETWCVGGVRMMVCSALSYTEPIVPAGCGSAHFRKLSGLGSYAPPAPHGNLVL
jgi:hypothetical protein